MAVFDFINQCTYSKPAGNLNDMESHPKFVLIRRDGTILYSDTSNDEKEITIQGQKVQCNKHEHYLAKLIENYYQNSEELVEMVQQGNYFAPIFEFLNEGDIIFNNLTIYQFPYFYLFGVRGQLLVPEQITNQQKESLQWLDSYIKFFGEVSVEEYQNNDINRRVSYCDKGSTAIINYFMRHNEHEKVKCKSYHYS